MVFQLPVFTGTFFKGGALTAMIALTSGMGKFLQLPSFSVLYLLFFIVVEPLSLFIFYARESYSNITRYSSLPTNIALSLNPTNRSHVCSFTIAYGFNFLTTHFSSSPLLLFTILPPPFSIMLFPSFAYH